METHLSASVGPILPAATLISGLLSWFSPLFFAEASPGLSPQPLHLLDTLPPFAPPSSLPCPRAARVPRTHLGVRDPFQVEGERGRNGERRSGKRSEEKRRRRRRRRFSPNRAAKRNRRENALSSSFPYTPSLFLFSSYFVSPSHFVRSILLHFVLSCTSIVFLPFLFSFSLSLLFSLSLSSLCISVFHLQQSRSLTSTLRSPFRSSDLFLYTCAPTSVAHWKIYAVNYRPGGATSRVVPGHGGNPPRDCSRLLYSLTHLLPSLFFFLSFVRSRSFCFARHGRSSGFFRSRGLNGVRKTSSSPGFSVEGHSRFRLAVTKCVVMDGGSALFSLSLSRKFSANIRFVRLGKFCAVISIAFPPK